MENTTAGCCFFRPRHCNVLSAAKYELKLLAECQWKGLAFDGLKMWPLQLTSMNRQIILPVIPIWPEFSVSGRSYRKGLEPPTVLFKVKNWRENWASMLAPTMREERVLSFCFFFFPPFLEGTQVSGRWQQDETQRQPGESLEGEPGSGSSQVLSWSALDKRETASSICSSLLCLITMRCPWTHCLCHPREFGVFGGEITNSVGKSVLNCVKK